MKSIGLGVTRHPSLTGADERMADLLRWTLRDPGTRTTGRQQLA